MVVVGASSAGAIFDTHMCVSVEVGDLVKLSHNFSMHCILVDSNRSPHIEEKKKKKRAHA